MRALRALLPKPDAVLELPLAAGVLVGVAPEVEAAAAAAHPDKWLVGGLYGVVQARIA